VYVGDNSQDIKAARTCNRKLVSGAVLWGRGQGKTSGGGSGLFLFYVYGVDGLGHK